MNRREKKVCVEIKSLIWKSPYAHPIRCSRKRSAVILPVSPIYYMLNLLETVTQIILENMIALMNEW